MPAGCGCGCGQVTIRSCTEAASDEHYDARSATIPNLQLRHDYSTAVYLHYHFAKSHTPASHRPAPTTRTTTPSPPLTPRPPLPPPSSSSPPPPPMPPPPTRHANPRPPRPRVHIHTDRARCIGSEGAEVVLWLWAREGAEASGGAARGLGRAAHHPPSPPVFVTTSTRIGGAGVKKDDCRSG